MCFKSIFRLPDFSYKWKCIEKDGSRKRWMYQTKIIVEKLNPYRVVGKQNYVIQVGYETERDSKIPLNKEKMLILDIAKKSRGSERYPDVHQYFLLIGKEEKYLMKNSWGKLILVPIDELPKIDEKIEKLIKKLLNNKVSD